MRAATSGELGARLAEGVDGLTRHEVRLIGLLAEGHSDKAAAAELPCSINTVAFHMKSI